MIDLKGYEHIRSGGAGFHEQERGLIAVWGKEAVQFLDGLISNDMKTLEDGQQMLAAFPNAQGRLLAVVRVLRQGDRYLFDTEGTTRDKVFNNLFRFTFAGDFFVEDLSEQYKYFEMFMAEPPALAGGIVFDMKTSAGIFVELADSDKFRETLISQNAIHITDDLYETLRIETGVPKYGVDMDETTIVPELGLDGLISYNKGCYIGQEIIARIHFRGHVAKRLAGIIADDQLVSGTELTIDGKNAGKIMSTAYSPSMDENLAIAYVRYDHLSPGTLLRAGDEYVKVTELPFF